MKKIIVFLLFSFVSKGQVSTSILPNKLAIQSNDTSGILKFSTFDDHSRLSGIVANGTSSNPTPPNSNQRLFEIGAKGYVNGSFRTGGNISFFTTENWGASYGSKINLITKTNNGGSYSDKLIIDHNGNVGMGTGGPKALLHILSGTNSNNNLTYFDFLIEKGSPSLISMIAPINVLTFRAANSHFNLKEESAAFGNTLTFTRSSYVPYITMISDASSRRNVSIGSNYFDTKLAVQGSYSLQKSVTINSNTTMNDYNRQKSSSIYLRGGGALNQITGIADGTDGLILYINVMFGTSVRIYHEDTRSQAQNRIITHTGSSFSIDGGGVTLIYDATAQRWRVIGIAN
ncbi:MAG: hypothetical protein ACRCVT_09070 [Leadbetterella sp.]